MVDSSAVWFITGCSGLENPLRVSTTTHHPLGALKHGDIACALQIWPIAASEGAQAIQRPRAKC